MPRTPSVGHVLNNAGSGLSQVIRRAKELNKLTKKLKTMVDAPLCEHIYVANIRDNTLVIGTDSAVWHTRVKYLAPVILEQIQQIQGLEQIRNIKFRVQPFGAETRRTKDDTQTTLAENKHDTSNGRQDKSSNEQSLKQILRGVTQKTDKKS